MRPYLAIIKDSFRAAMASRVLYVLLLLITILLLAIAPLHMRETLDWEIKLDENVDKPSAMVRRLVERHDQTGEKPIARIWELFPADLPDKLIEYVQEEEEQGQTEPVAEDPPRRRGGPPPELTKRLRLYEETIDALNDVIQNPDFYQADDWEGRPLGQEAEDLIEQGVDNLTEIRVRRLNRILVSMALSPTIETGNSTALEFYYAFGKLSFLSTSATHQQFAQELTRQLPFYFDKFVMSIGLLIAIVITANIIPETFEPGSLNLLLSKPITRTGLFLSKFIGGCVFIALCAAYLFLGLWLWLGLAMEVWDRAILFSILLYILVFAIYFSVSAFVGLLYRSAIVAVILTLLFWAFCFGVGFLFGLFDVRMKNAAIVKLVPTQNEVLTVDILHAISNWDDKENDWQETLGPDMRDEERMGLGITMFFAPLYNEFPRPLGPIYDAANDQVIATQFRMQDIQATGRRPLWIAPSGQTSFVEAGRFPRDTTELFATGSGIMAVTGEGLVYLLDDDRLSQSLVESGSNGEKEQADEEGTQSSQELFDSIGPIDPVSIRSANYVAHNQSNDRIAIYDRGTLHLFERDEEDYRKFASLELNIEFDNRMSCVMDYQGDTVVLVFGNGQVITVDGDKLVERNSYLPEKRSAIESVQGSPDGRWFALVYRNRNLWVLDRQNHDYLSRADVAGQGSITAVAFRDDNHLWIADRTDRSTLYNIESGVQETQSAPAGGWIENIYRYFLVPVYRVCPKPGEFYKVVTYLSKAGDTQANEDVDLRRTSEGEDPWSPLWTGLIFMGIMLVCACVAFHFKDF